LDNVNRIKQLPGGVPQRAAPLLSLETRSELDLRNSIRGDTPSWRNPRRRNVATVLRDLAPETFAAREHERLATAERVAQPEAEPHAGKI